MLALAPTARHTVLVDGSARLLRFGRGDAARGLPLLLVPSLINRWYVLDLRPGASVVEALVGAGLDVFCLDWGAPRDEDRYLTWDDLVVRLDRAVRRVRRLTGAPRVGLLGYSMGATLAAIEAARWPRRVAALVNLAGPIDFSRAGRLRTLADPRWLSAEAMAAAGNIHPWTIRAGLVSVRPTDWVAKWVGLLDHLGDRAALEDFWAREAWVSDNVAFPAGVYLRFVRDLYQRNELVAGEHHVAGRRVDLGAIECPVLTVVPDDDVICPPASALALGEHVGSTRVDVLRIPGSHIEAVVGPRAAQTLYPPLGRWLQDTLCS
ncbi:MAG: alpha/beta fold hydrolase [Myxococcales bacterium]|nr:alpha/beta fold hydrolase [Myxococcales bacterium]